VFLERSVEAGSQKRAHDRIALADSFDGGGHGQMGSHGDRRTKPREKL
jgi:hypothetical protein